MTDETLDHEKDNDVDIDKRRFLFSAGTVIGGVGVACAVTPLISSWFPSARAQAAGAPVEVNLAKMEAGQQVTVEWRGKPVWIIKRTDDMLAQLSENESQLRDPESLVEQQPVYAKNRNRSIKPEYLVLIGVCTHLGCSPKYMPTIGELGANWPGGFYCPCHGSTFDMSGRVFKGVPAPINLEVPPYSFLQQDVIIIGQEQEQQA